jgi:hypothetical protein
LCLPGGGHGRSINSLGIATSDAFGPISCSIPLCWDYSALRPVVRADGVPGGLCVTRDGDFSLN